MGLGIKKNDTVMIISGREKGKKGRVLSVLPSDNRVVVEKVNIIKRHMKPSKKYAQGGIIEREASIHRSNVMLVCPRCSKPARVSNMIFENGKKTRVCKKCREVIDQ